jgi:two-component system CheB/CheR fusion protein
VGTELEHDQAELERLLVLLKETRGIDFMGYKRPTLVRRIARRMNAVGVSSYAEYRDHLEVQPEEYGHLFDSLLINVTSFFRDRSAWDVLRERVVPEILSAKPPGAGLRIWSAGCATGEEAYTLAMILVEELGVDEFRARVKIYATDLDEKALQVARAGVYEERRLSDLPPGFREKYFESGGGRHTFRRDLRRQVIFGRNDLTKDAPISRVDLLTVRNTLMYFNAETQATILRRLHFALSDPGYVFLGKAEMLMNHVDRFEPVDLRKRLFCKIPRTTPVITRRADEYPADNGSPVTRLRAAVLAAGPVAQLAVDAEDKLAMANSRAETLFGFRATDVGRPFQDLEVSYRPVELRSLIDRAKREVRPVELQSVEWQRPGGGGATVYDVSVVPLCDDDGPLIGVSISFTEVTRYNRLRAELEHANEELERAYQELQSLNEELETTNEELQSTNEELETTNEELQSTNEELETMNEELQSTNDELQEINDALRTRTDELHGTNAFLASVLQSLGTAVIVVDVELRVSVWSPGSEDLWGLRADEATGRHLLALDIGLPSKELIPVIQRTLSEELPAKSAVSIEAINRRGREIRLRVDSSLLRDGRGIRGVILMMNHTDAAVPAT